MPTSLPLFTELVFTPVPPQGVSTNHIAGLSQTLWASFVLAEPLRESYVLAGSTALQGHVWVIPFIGIIVCFAKGVISHKINRPVYLFILRIHWCSVLESIQTLTSLIPARELCSTRWNPSHLWSRPWPLSQTGALELHVLGWAYISHFQLA